MSENIILILLLLIAFFLYSSWSNKRNSDDMSIELSNLEKDLKSLQYWVEISEKTNETLSKKLAKAKRHNEYLYLSREHHIFDVLDEFIKQASNLEKDEK